MMHFDSPLAFLLFFLAPIMFRPTRFFRPTRTSDALLFASPAPLAEVLRTIPQRSHNLLAPFLRLLTLTLLIIAAARPQTGIEYTEVETSGRDIMLTLDISGSMQALDFRLNSQRVDRLTALKHVVNEFIAERKGDRIGLVIFGTDVFTQCPLTSDHGILADFVDRLDFGMVGDGTAMGDAIALSVKRIREIPGQSKVIVLVTDGLKTAGSIDPKEAAQIAKKEGIKVYTIGIGGNKPAPFPVKTAFGNTVLQYVDNPLDVDTLKEIAEITGAKFFRAAETESLRQVYQEINTLEERKEHETQFVEYREQFPTFLMLGLLCFFAHLILSTTRNVIIP